jgi:hypothetical protein
MNANRVGSGARERLYPSTTDTYDDTLDLDLIAIERAINGEPVQLTALEKIHAARLLDSRGYSAGHIAGRLGSDHSTITGWKANGWKPGNHPKSRISTKPRREPPVCGEPRMYRKHIRDGETPCRPCREANAAADRRYRLTGSTQTAA